MANFLTPKQKAHDLISDFYRFAFQQAVALDCARMLAAEMVSEFERVNTDKRVYWEEVRKQLDSLTT